MSSSALRSAVLSPGREVLFDAPGGGGGGIFLTSAELDNIAQVGHLNASVSYRQCVYTASYMLH